MSEWTSELKLLISTSVGRAEEDLRHIGEDVDKMAANVRAGATVSSESLDHLKMSVEELHAEMATMRDVIVKIHVDDAEALAKEEAFKAETESIPNNVNVNQTAGAGGGGMGPLAAIGISAIPGLIPVAAAATNAVMGLASAFTSASAGVGGFAAVAISDLKSVFTATSALNTAEQAYATATTSKQRTAALQAEQKALYGLDGAQIQAVHTLQHFENYWSSFADSFQKPVFEVFRLGLQSIETLMSDMKPVITAASGAIGTLMKQLNGGLKSGDNKNFFNWLAKTAGPAILAFGHAAGAILRGIGSLMMDFTGPANQMEHSLVRITNGFARWADQLSKTQGFKEFLAYASTSGTQVMHMFGKLFKVLGALIVVLAPLGLEMVKIVKDLAAWINQLLRTNPVIRILIHVIITAVKNVLIFVDVVVKVFMWLGKTHPVIMDIVTALGLATGAFFAFNAVMDANPISLIIIAIAGLVAAVVELVKHWRTVVGWLRDAWNWFKHLGVGVQFAIAELMPFIGIPALIIAHWRQIRTFFQHIGTDIEVAFRVMIGNAFRWGANFINMFKNGVMSGVHAVTSAVSHVANTVRRFLGFGSPTEAGPGASSDRWAPNFIRMYTAGLEAGVPKVQEALRKVLEPGTQIGVNASVNGSPQSLAGDTAQQLSSGEVHHHNEIHNHITVHANNLNDPHEMDQLAQRLAIWQQQHLHAIGANG